MSSTIKQGSELQNLLRRVTETDEFRNLVAHVRNGARLLSVSGLTIAPARALIVAALQLETGKRMAV